MTRAGPISAERLKSFESRITNLLDEKQVLTSDVADIYQEAKSAGVNTTALRKVIAKRRAKAPDPEVVAAMEAYEFALNQAASMVSNGSTSLRRAAAETGFSKSAIQRRVSHRNENTSSGTAETGSATVVATTDAATTQDAAGRTEPPVFDPDRDMPAHLRRKPGEGHGLAPAQKPAPTHPHEGRAEE